MARVAKDAALDTSVHRHESLEGGMADRTDHLMHVQHGHTRRAFLEAGALALVGLAAPPLALPATAQAPKRGGTLVIAADVSPAGARPAEVRGRA
jgi:hypothetical protein